MATPLEQGAAQLAGAPMPTEATLKMRKNIVIQFTRFIVINLKMVGIILKGHHG